MCRLLIVFAGFLGVFASAFGLAADAVTDFSQWQKQFSQRAPNSVELAQGVQLAKLRRVALSELIQTDPDAALAGSIAETARAELPAVVRAELETIVEADALYTNRVDMFHSAMAAGHVHAAMSADDATDSGSFMSANYVPVLLVGDVAYFRHAAGVRARVAHLQVQPVRGIALNGHIAIASDVARLISDPSELVIAQARVATRNACAKPQTPIYARVGAGYRGFCGAAELSDFNAGQTAYLESLIGGPMPATAALNPYTTGPKTFLLMRVRFSDQADSVVPTEAQAQAQLTGLNDFMRDFSYGQLSQVLGTVTPILVLANPVQYYIDQGNNTGIVTILAEARTLAAAAGFNYNNFNFEAASYVGGPGAFAGAAYVGGRGMWLKTSDAGVAAHELGHNLGLLHANYWAPTNADPLGVGVNNEYGNPFDRLGSGGSRAAHFTASAKARLSWLAPDRSVRMWGNGDYTLQAQDQTQLPSGAPVSNAMAAVVLQEKLFMPVATAIASTEGFSGRFWLEHRTQQSAFATALHANMDARENWLMDLTPRSRNGKNDAGLRLGATLSEPGLGLHLTPTAINTSLNPPRFQVHVEHGNFAANTKPVVTLAASVLTAAINVPITFSATANDTDGDPLAYSWEREDSVFVAQNANQIVQSFTAAGKYRVRVRASDMRGGNASASVIVTIGAPSGFSLSGQILADGVPVENAIVGNGAAGTLFRLASTDSDGRFVVTNLLSGTTTLTAFKRGLAFTPIFTNPITVAADQANLDFSGVSEPTFQLSVVDATALPGSADTATVRIQRVGNGAAAANVFFRITGNATNPADFTVLPAGNAPISFAAGQTQADLVFTALANTAGERSETMQVSLYDGVDYELAYPSSGLVTITGVTAPINDSFASRTLVSSASALLSGDNRLATLEVGEPPHGPNFSGYNSLWWSWTAPVTGPVAITTTGTATTIALDVYSGNSLITLNPIATMLSRNAAVETLSFNALAGTAYAFAVSAENAFAATGLFSVQIQQNEPSDSLFANGFE
jgi:hypothetical protein